MQIDGQDDNMISPNIDLHNSAGSATPFAQPELSSDPLSLSLYQYFQFPSEDNEPGELQPSHPVSFDFSPSLPSLYKQMAARYRPAQQLFTTESSSTMEYHPPSLVTSENHYTSQHMAAATALAPTLPGEASHGTSLDIILVTQPVEHPERPVRKRARICQPQRSSHIDPS
jgi:hypothetical protein